MMFITSKNSINQNLIALTGVTKAGFLLKRQNLSSHRSKWKSCFVILNDHCLSYCCEKSRFERPEGNILITAGTKVYPQAGEEGVIRVETGCEVMFLRGRDGHEMKEWTKSIRANVSKLKTLARGQFRVKTKGRVREFFFMLHRECITAHPSFSQTIIISKIFPITESSSFEVNGNRVDFKSDTNGETLSIVAKNDIEHRHWCYSLRLAIESQRNCAEKSAIPPPAMPVHSGSLLLLDSANMKWARKYLVLTEDCLYIHGHRRVGFHAPQKFILTPNVMIFSTTLKEYSFELVFFSDSIHLCAASEEEKGEWIHALEQLIPRSSYDKDDELQAACFDRDVDFSTVLFQSERSPGMLLERRGNWAIVSSVSEDLSRLVFPGSILASVNEESAMVLGFERVAHELRNWIPPLRLNFFISPRKMGWLGMVLNERSKSWWNTASGSVTTSVSWEKVYATLSQGVLTLFTDLKKDGKSKKRVIPLYGSAVSLAHVESVNGNRNCFRILNGMQSIALKANSYDDMIDWATAIVHGISMENGGGFLLEKEQNDRKRNRRGFPIQKKETGLAFQGADDGPGGGEHGRTLSGDGAYTTFLRSISPISLKEGSNECRDLRDFKPSHLPPIMEQDNKSKELNVSHFTDFTEAETTFKSLDPADLSETMENFARDFFVFKTSKYPVQALTKEYNDDPWVDIDRASSATGSSALSEVLEIDGNSHVSKDNFNKLLQYTTNSLKISDFDVGVGAF